MTRLTAATPAAWTHAACTICAVQDESSSETADSTSASIQLPANAVSHNLFLNIIISRVHQNEKETNETYAE